VVDDWCFGVRRGHEHVGESLLKTLVSPVKPHDLARYICVVAMHI